MGVQAYRHGVKANQLPEPFYFFWGSAAFGICGVVAMANKNVGVILAWGLLLGAGIIDYSQRTNAQKTASKNANPSATQVSSAGRAQITTVQQGTVPGSGVRAK
jgi:hypothetical protein